jgi:hypothetical protein
MQNVIDSLVEGGGGPERENHERDDEAPEIQFATVPKRVGSVGRPRRALHPIQQQELELEAQAQRMIDDLLWWTTALKTARKAQQPN